MRLDNVLKKTLGNLKNHFRIEMNLKIPDANKTGKSFAVISM